LLRHATSSSTCGQQEILEKKRYKFHRVKSIISKDIDVSSPRSLALAADPQLVIWIALPPGMLSVGRRLAQWWSITFPIGRLGE